MAELHRYVAILRCRTWHIWPERIHIGTKRFRLELDEGVEAIAHVAVASYLARSVPDDYTSERAEVGPLVWRGDVPGLYTVREAILKSPDDVVSITLEHEPPRKGEIDILVGIEGPGELLSRTPDVLRGIAFALLALFNLRLGDYLIPCAPLQVSCVVANGRQFDNTLSVTVQNREELSVPAVQDVMSEFFNEVVRESRSDKLQTALELYASHFFEPGAKTRFLLLVMAMEVLANPTVKHTAALRLLDNWQVELTEEKARFAESSAEFADLEALERELLFRREDSIRSQLRHLMLRVSAAEPNGRGDLPRRVLKVYDKRSALVHDGTLPATEIVGLELEARGLLEAAFRFILTEPNKRGLAG